MLHIATHTRLDGRVADVEGRSVLIATADQLAAVWAMIELDGVARRLVIVPPDLSPGHADALIRDAEIDVVVFDGENASFANALRPVSGRHLLVREAAAALRGRVREGRTSEWLLLSSGTCGPPKIVVHNLASLTAGIDSHAGEQAVWGTFYDVRRFGGLQILLRAAMCGASLVLADAGETAADHLNRLMAHNVTHVSGTPSHWRRSLMSALGKRLHPCYIRISGEIAEQSLLDELRRTYAGASICHAFASTEAGVCFEVNDGQEGFPSSLIDGSGGKVEIKVVDGTLRIRSERTASHYIGRNAGNLRDELGFVDTRDLIEPRNNRYHFVGRKDGVINIGGLKVHPEEVEAVINRHPKVNGSLVTSRRSPLTGRSLVAEIKLKAGAQSGAHVAGLESEIIEHCRRDLAKHMVPVAIRFVGELGIGESGKLLRSESARRQELGFAGSR